MVCCCLFIWSVFVCCCVIFVCVFHVFFVLFCFVVICVGFFVRGLLFLGDLIKHIYCIDK